MLKESLKEWMPEYYTGENVSAIQSARDEEFKIQQAKQDRVYGDMYVSKARDIDLWENEYGVVPTTEDLERRQKNMIAYIRSNGGAATKEMIKNVVSSYTGSDAVEVVEFSDQFLDKIKCTYDATEEISFDDLETMLYEMMQAHADFVIDRIKISDVTTTLYRGLALRGQFQINPIIAT